MEQITREEMIAAIDDLVDWAYRQICPHEETHRGGAIWEICSSCGAKWADDEGGKPEFKLPEEVANAERVSAALQAAEPAMVVDIRRDLRDGSPSPRILKFTDLGDGEHQLFTLPCPPAKVSHWSLENPGRADQYRAEALAVRRALGFREDADDVAPADLEDAINALRQPATELAPESWREELETIAEILEADGDEWNCAARIRKMLKTSPAKVQVPEGYAGVTVWVGDRQVTQIVNQTELVSSNADELLRRFENARHLLTASPAPAHIPGAGEMIDDHIGDGNEMVSALRQYRHNDDSGFVFAYDKEQTDRIVTGLVEALEQIAESRDVGRYDGKPEDGPMLTDTEMWLIAQEALNTYLQQEETER